jgi:hypothetical protein
MKILNYMLGKGRGMDTAMKEDTKPMTALLRRLATPIPETATPQELRNMGSEDQKKYVVAKAWKKATGKRLVVITERDVQELRDRVAAHDFLTGKPKQAL